MGSESLEGAPFAAQPHAGVVPGLAFGNPEHGLYLQEEFRGDIANVATGLQQRRGVLYFRTSVALPRFYDTGQTGHFTDRCEAAILTMMTCPECKGRGYIDLLTKRVPCTACAVESAKSAVTSPSGEVLFPPGHLFSVRLNKVGGMQGTETTTATWTGVVHLAEAIEKSNFDDL